MHACLVFHLHQHAEIGAGRLHASRHGILCGERKVGRVEVKQVVIANACAREFAGASVPRRLKQAACHQPSVGKVQRGQALQDGAVGRVGESIANKNPGQFGGATRRGGRGGRDQPTTLAMAWHT